MNFLSFLGCSVEVLDVVLLETCCAKLLSPTNPFLPVLFSVIFLFMYWFVNPKVDAIDSPPIAFILFILSSLFIAEVLLMFLLVKISCPKSTVSLNKLLIVVERVFSLYLVEILLTPRAFITRLSVI